MMDVIDQPAGAFELCDFSLGAYWQPGRWTRDKLRGAALSDPDLRDQDVEPLEILRAPFHVGWIIEAEAETDGEWCDPAWPVYRLETSEPEPGTKAMEASWLSLGMSP